MKFLFKSQGANAPCDFFVGACACARDNIFPPRRALHAPPRHTEPPTQTMFARGPVVAVGILVWYRSGILFDHPVAQSATPLRREEL